MFNKSWILARRPEGALRPGDLKLVETPVPALGAGEVLVRNIYLSLDPTNRIWMSDREQYMPPVEIGDVMRGGTVGVVEQSRSDKFKAGDIVMPFAGWTLYAVCPEKTIRAVPSLPGIPLTAYMSVLGGNGMTAYFGLLEVGQPKPGETVVVTAAAGSVGSIAGQIAKIKGCRTIGIAGGAQKCRWLTEELGFDGAIDYKSEDVGAALDKLCPKGVDVSFENVGGPIMNAVYERLNEHGRMALCGLISTYNADGPAEGPRDFSRILMKKLTIRGFIVMDFMPRAAEAFGALAGWIGEGRLKWKTHVEQGLENAPAALERLFTGNHDGKLLVQLSPEP